MSDLDLKERLRHRSTMMRVDNPDAKLMDEAADRIAALEDALRPFAELGKMLDGTFAVCLFKDGDSAGIGGAWKENGEPRFVTFGDLRTAARLLTQGEA